MAGRGVASLIVIALAVSLVALFSSGTPSQASWLNAGMETRLHCNEGSCTPGTEYNPDVTADYDGDFSIPAPSANFATNITTFPPDWYLAGHGAVPVGAEMGYLDSATRLGLLNQPCQQLLATHFDFRAGTTDITNTFAVAPSMVDIRDDDCDPGNGLWNHIDCYPDFEVCLFDPDFTSLGADGICGTGDDINGPKKPLIPRARLTGYDCVAGICPGGGQDVLLDFVVFNPGQLADPTYGFASPHPFSQIGPEFGYVTIVVLNNPIVPLSPSAITDFCSPLGTVTTLFGLSQDNASTGADESNYVARKNPPANTGLADSAGAGTNTHLFTYVSVSYRDLDNDGAEAGVDTCEGQVNQQDYRLTTGPDGDMIDQACDNNPGANDGVDADSDGYHNAQDNCPQIANGGACYGLGCQWETENISALPADGGPVGDGMGDDCDPQPAVSDGHYHVNMNLWPVCIGDPPVDADGDGWCDATETALGSNPAVNASGDHDGDGVANAVDNCPVDYNPAPQADTDGDTIGDVCETAHADQGGFGDYDGDTVANAADNCDHFPNPVIPQPDADSDGIGDECDPIINSDYSPYGRPEHNQLTFFPAGTLYETFAAPIAPGATGVNEPCDDGIDNDNDGFIDGADTGCQSPGDADKDGIDDASDNCPAVKNQTQTNHDADSDGDACDTDDDDDKSPPGNLYTDAREYYMGTDPLDDCPDVVGKHDAWPMDHSKDRTLTAVGDLLPYRGKIGQPIRRLDLNTDGTVTAVGDLLQYRARIGWSCP